MANSKSVGLNIVIAGDPTGFSRASKVVQVETTGMAGKLKGLATGAGAFFAGAAIVRWGQDAIKTYRSVGGELLKLQRLTGGSESFTSGLFVGAQQSGVSIEKLSSAIGILSSKVNNKAVEKLGIDLKNADGSARPFEAVLRDIMDRFAAMENGADKNLIARTLFGRSGTDLIPLLNKGGEALDEFIEKAKDLGISLNAEDIKKATANQREFQLATQAAGFAIGKELLPAVTSFTTWAATNLPKIIGPITAIGNAFNGLPGPIKATFAAMLLAGPAVKVLSFVVTPVRALGSVLGQVTKETSLFRLGLAGATEKGSGFANSLGGAINSLGGLKAAAVAGGVAIAALTVVYIKYSEGQANAKRRAQETEASILSVAKAAVDSGRTVGAVFDEIVLRDAYLDKRNLFDKLSISAADLKNALKSSKGDLTTFLATVTKKMPDDQILAGDDLADLEQLFKVYREAPGAARDLTQANNDLGISESDAADSAGLLTGGLGEQETALDRATKAVEDHRSKLEAIRSAQQGYADAHTASRDAQDALTEAQKAATGDSEEYRDAVDAVADAQRGVGDAERDVVEARRGQVTAAVAVRDAQSQLNDAYADAKKRIDDMAEAAREARDDEAEAIQTAREKAEANRLAQGNTQLSQLEKDRAALDARLAADDASDKGRDATQAERDAAAAQAAGVQGDEGVISAQKRVADAKQGVVEANQRVVDAEGKVRDAVKAVGDAQVAQRKVVSDAKAAVVEATKKAEQATFDEAQAWGELRGAQDGATAGVEAHRQALLLLAADLAPGSPLRLNLEAYAAQLAGVLAPVSPSGLGSLGSTAPPGAQNAERNSRSSGSGAAANGISVTVNANGTPAQQNRKLRDTAQDVADAIAKGGM